MSEISTSIRRAFVKFWRIASSCEPGRDGQRRLSPSTLLASSACSYRLMRSRTPSSSAFELSAGTLEDVVERTAGGIGGGGAGAAGSGAGALVVGGGGTIGAGAADPEGGGAG